MNHSTSKIFHTDVHCKKLYTFRSPNKALNIPHHDQTRSIHWSYILATVYHHDHQFGRGMLTLYSIGYSNVHIKHQECAKEDQKQQPATTASDITGGPLHQNFRSFNTIYPRTSVTVNPRFVTVWIISVSLGFLAIHHVVLMALTVRVIVNEVHTVRNSPHSENTVHRD